MLAQAAFEGALSAVPGMNDRQFALLAAAHNLSRDQTLMDLGSRVSRKLEFMPAVKGVLEDPSFSATLSTFPPIMTTPLQNNT
eukprot:COSAG01_NODE_16671_length_1216_cov_1.749329_1_plen_83_part_10